MAEGRNSGKTSDIIAELFKTGSERSRQQVAALSLAQSIGSGKGELAESQAIQFITQKRLTLQNAVRRQATKPRAYIEAAEFETQLGDLERARYYFRTGVRRCPYSAPLWRAWARAEAGISLSGSVGVLSQAVKSLPHETSLWRELLQRTIDCGGNPESVFDDWAHCTKPSTEALWEKIRYLVASGACEEQIRAEWRNLTQNPSAKAYIAWADWENSVASTREVFADGVRNLRGHKDFPEILVRFAKFELEVGEVGRALAILDLDTSGTPSVLAFRTRISGNSENGIKTAAEHSATISSALKSIPTPDSVTLQCVLKLRCETFLNILRQKRDAPLDGLLDFLQSVLTHRPPNSDPLQWEAYSSHFVTITDCLRSVNSPEWSCDALLTLLENGLALHPSIHGCGPSSVVLGCRRVAVPSCDVREPFPAPSPAFLHSLATVAIGLLADPLEDQTYSLTRVTDVLKNVCDQLGLAARGAVACEKRPTFLLTQSSFQELASAADTLFEYSCAHSLTTSDATVLRAARAIQERIAWSWMCSCPSSSGLMYACRLWPSVSADLTAAALIHSGVIPDADSVLDLVSSGCVTCTVEALAELGQRSPRVLLLSLLTEARRHANPRLALAFLSRDIFCRLGRAITDMQKIRDEAVTASRNLAVALAVEGVTIDPDALVDPTLIFREGSLRLARATLLFSMKSCGIDNYLAAADWPQWVFASDDFGSTRVFNDITVPWPIFPDIDDAPRLPGKPDYLDSQSSPSLSLAEAALRWKLNKIAE